MILSEQNYFSDEAQKEYCGSSQFKQFCECPAKAMAVLNGEWKDKTSDSQLVGSYVDASISNTLDIFKELHPEIFTQKRRIKSTI